MIAIATRNVAGLLLAASGILVPLNTSAASVNAAPIPFVQSPIPAIGADAGMRSVAALSESDAWAVGATIERWTGKSWIEIPGGVVGANTHDFPLNSVAIVPGTKPAHAWAVGSVLTNKEVQLSRIENWNGKKWALLQSPALPGVTLNGVTAISGKDAWAVGFTENGTPTEPVILHWNGGKWVSSGLPNLINGGVLTGVASIGPNSIWAVGWYHNAPNTEATLVEHWNGHKWSIVPSINPSATDSELTSVAAVPGGGLWTAGFYSGTTGDVPLVERLVGSSVVAQPVQKPNLPASFRSVAVRGSNDAWAVGVQGTNRITSLTEHWNGHAWTIVPSRNRRNGSNLLNSVAHIPRTDSFWSVGGLAERWNGSTWSTRPALNIGADNNVEGVAVTLDRGTPQAWVAGNSDVPGVDHDVVWHWNGKAWSFMQLPGPSDYVTSIGASSNSHVFVGGSYYSGENVPSVRAWNGHAWSELPSPAPPNSNGEVSALDSLTGKDLWAAGSYDNGGSFQVPMLARWNGVNWTSVTATCPALSEDVYLTSVSAVTDTNVWAAGKTSSSNGYRTVVLHWDGAQCTIATEQNNHTVDDELSATLARSNGDVWAVGTRSRKNTEFCLTQRNSGATWTISQAVNPGGACQFQGIASAGGGGLWAVGAVVRKSVLPLIEWWDGSAWHVNRSAALNHPDAYLSSASGTPDGHTVFAVGQSINRFGILQPFAVVRVSG